MDHENIANHDDLFLFAKKITCKPYRNKISFLRQTLPVSLVCHGPVRECSTAAISKIHSINSITIGWRAIPGTIS